MIDFNVKTISSNVLNDGSVDIYMPLKAASKLTNALHESSPHPCKLRPHPSLSRIGYLVVEYKLSDSVDALSIHIPYSDDVSENTKICSDQIENLVPENVKIDLDLNQQVESVSIKNASNRRAISYQSVVNDASLHGVYHCDVVLECLGCYTLSDMRGTDILDIQFSVKEVYIISRFVE